MNFYLYRFQPDASRIMDRDFVAIEIAPELDDAVAELHQDVLDDLFCQLNLEPSGIELSMPAEFSDRRTPDIKYMITASKTGPRATKSLYYGIGNAPSCRTHRRG